MPMYEYRCTKCGHEFEVIQKFSDPVKRKCPECGGRLEKLLSRTSFQLKGGGWFDQGYGSGSAKSGAKTKSPGAAKGDKGSSKKDPGTKSLAAAGNSKS